MNTDNVQSPTTNGKYKPASREKYWAELDTEGKIERTRQMVKSFEYTLSNFIERLNKLENHFYSHQHGSEGKLIKELKQYDNQLPSISGLSVKGLNQNPNEVYF